MKNLLGTGARVVRCVFVCLILIAGGRPSRAQKVQYVIDQITVEGTTRFSKSQIALASGLKPGQPADDPVLSAAAERLAKTGEFSEVQYRYTTLSGKMTVRFQVIDDPKTLECTFDNFVWFAPNELDRAVRAEVPLYDARMPFDSEVTRATAQALEHLLVQHHISATVSFLPASKALGAPPTALLFSAKGNLPPVTSVEFTGGPLEPELFSLQKSRLIGHPFSAFYTHSMAENDLDAIYHNHAYLRAHFTDPQVTFVPGANDSDPGSIKLVFTVSPGALYAWHGADWQGNAVYAPPDLDGYLAMKEGEPAAADKIASGEDAVRQAYGKKGYITATVSSSQNLDDGAHQVHYSYQVSEGSQYHMGTFGVFGYDDNNAQRLRKMWQLKPGEIYDASYIREFAKKGMPIPAGTNFSGANPPRSKIVAVPHRDTLLVDVTLSLSTSAN
ncbi:MAG TPA: POTRA domain-containing protein [Candidatus Sulfotelmatobacter sp.]|nr:POTRA domain-containing protein [Candidatus Sulfotelmatobacter sp.]